MKKIVFLSTILISSLLFSSCKKGFNFQKESLIQLSEELQNKFTEDAWYTSIIIRGQNGTHNTVVVDVTKDPNSLKQEQWAYDGGFWEKKSNISLEVEGEPTNYMFQIDNEISLEFAYNLIDKTLDDLKNEEEILDPLDVRTLSIRSSSEMNSKEEGVLYTITIFNENTAKSYSYVYYLNGELKNKNL
ncbi:MAG TPA: hypothetical protein VK027_07505 [Chitinophagaceae bacterium]|nr:hypothetical protein [Chitinophagaceae bacterium]